MQSTLHQCASQEAAQKRGGGTEGKKELKN